MGNEEENNFLHQLALLAMDSELNTLFCGLYQSRFLHLGLVNDFTRPKLIFSIQSIWRAV
jgi:hypothetical protein